MCSTDKDQVVNIILLYKSDWAWQPLKYIIIFSSLSYNYTCMHWGTYWSLSSFIPVPATIQKGYRTLSREFFLNGSIRHERRVVVLCGALGKRGDNKTFMVLGLDTQQFLSLVFVVNSHRESFSNLTSLRDTVAQLSDETKRRTRACQH